ncbi:hypothetical protein FANTH_935 [Fusarium anthophilum]|uniref:Ankyrin repeat protein n=1 Tax=Fusarium anthophilum TaxID=48485 RepID=A0A8H5EBZ6_9HYPO|nr:hypothetical protein FANTH_935 [Fusarium anthophilum]
MLGSVASQKRTLRSDTLRVISVGASNDFDFDRVKHLLKAALAIKTDAFIVIILVPRELKTNPSADKGSMADRVQIGKQMVTPLYVAAYMNETTEEAMKLLLEHGADPNDGGSKGYPPLVRALEDSSLDKFTFLLANGAKPSVRHADRSILTIVLKLPDTLVVLKYQLVRHLVVVLGVNVYESATRTSPALRAGTAQGCLSGYKELILDILTDSIPEPYLQDQLNDALEFCCRKSEPPFFWRPHTSALFYLVARQGFNNLLHLVCADRDKSDHEHHND